MTDALRDQLQDSLGDAYTIERELGGGGMSRVYVAQERAFARRVVIKLLEPELAAGVSVERFEREIQLAARLQHPHIVPVITAGESGGLPYYTMPMVEGESLRARLSAGHPMGIGETIAVLRDVGRALAYAHERGIVHRDVKPDNILLSGGSAMVADFGIAKALDASKTQEAGAALTQLGTGIGSPAYMAPEQAAADPDTDHRADIYAFGCVAYEMLTGHAVFADRPMHRLMMAHASEEPVPLGQLRADTPPLLAHLVMRCLAKDPAARPQHARDVLEVLDAAGIGLPSPLASARPRRMMFATAIAAGVATIVAGALFIRARPTAAKIDARVIAVAPFRAAGVDPSLRYLREGMPDLLAAKLSSGSGTRTLDSRTLLAAWRKAAGSEAADLPDSIARDMARTLGAGQIVVGEIVGSPTHLTLTARLMDAVAATSTAASVVGPADSLAALVDRLTAQLLTLRAGEGANMASLLSTSLPALKDYLEGQAFSRHAEWAAARAHFNSALDADSTFAQAALRVRDMCGWVECGPDQARALRLARRYQSRLGAKDRALLLVLDGPHPPRWRTGAEFLRAAEAYTVLAPDAADAWYRVGEAYFHYGRVVGYADASRRAERAISRSLALDSSYAPAYEHLLGIYADLNDIAAFRRASAILARDSGQVMFPAHRLIAAYVTGDSANLRVARAAIPSMKKTARDELYYFAERGLASVDDAQRAADADSAAAVSPAERTEAALMQAELAYDRGRPRRAAHALKMVTSQLGRDYRSIVGATIWDADSASGAATAVRLAAVSIPTAASASFTLQAEALSRAVLLAFFHASVPDTARARADIQAMQRIPFANDSLDLSGRRGRYVAMLEAQLALVGHRPDLRKRLTVLDSIIGEANGDFLSQVGPFISARGWESLGDIPRARDMIARQAVYVKHYVGYSMRLREQGRLAALAGDREGAIRAYRLFLHVRNDPEPALKEDTERVRTELAKLERPR